MASDAAKRYRQKNSQWPQYEVVGEDGLSVTLRITDSLREWKVGEVVSVPKGEFDSKFEAVRRG